MLQELMLIPAMGAIATPNMDPDVADLCSPSETELLLSLQKAVLEEKGWIEFLGRLASLTNASFSAIIVENARSLETARIMTATPKGSPTSISSDMLAEIFQRNFDRIEFMRRQN